MRVLFALFLLALLSCGCGKLTPNQCQAYAKIAEALALQIAELADPASPEDADLRKRWADVGEMAVEAGCEHLPPVEEAVASIRAAQARRAQSGPLSAPGAAQPG